MANHATNSVEFSGTEENLQQVMGLFSAMEALENETGKGQLPEFILNNPELMDITGYFHSISIYEANSINWESKWSPNIDRVVEIAKHFGVSFVMDYEELGCGIYGKAIYTAGDETAQEYDLTDEDLDQYESDDDNDCYLFRGEEYESQYDILNILFEERFNFEF